MYCSSINLLSSYVLNSLVCFNLKLHNCYYYNTVEFRWGFPTYPLDIIDCTSLFDPTDHPGDRFG